MKNPSLIFIVGPTAVGKSEIGLAAAGRLNGEIVSCDALQVYKEINIANDKPSAAARKKIPHHLVDVVSVTEEFNAALFRKLAVSTIEAIQKNGKTPLAIGGSGLYMSVLLDGIFEGAKVNEDVREELSQQLAERGSLALHGRLKSLDPDAAAKIHPNDPQRIIRALEVVLATGKPISRLQQERQGLWGRMPVKLFALNRPREELYRRVEARIDRMFDQGLVEEIRGISRLALSATSRKLIGVPEVTGYLKGEYDLARAKYLMKLHTRHYVKRQLTWFRREKRLIWIDIDEGQPAQAVAETILKSL